MGKKKENQDTLIQEKNKTDTIMIFVDEKRTFLPSKGETRRGIG